MVMVLNGNGDANGIKWFVMVMVIVMVMVMMKIEKQFIGKRICF